MSISMATLGDWYAAFHNAQLAPRLLAARPKLESFEAHMLIVRSKERVIAAAPQADTVDELAAIALSPFQGLRYLKRSGF